MSETEKIKKKPSYNNNHKHIVILGSGFAGIEVLKKLQKKFHNNKNIEITLVSKDNFILFTPMLPEVASGMIEIRHVVTTVRSFCKQANFYEADVESIDLGNRQIVITHAIGRQSQPTDWREHTLKYDYLVIALGSENNFFKMSDIEKYSFTMKNIDDAIILRNHIINILEQAILEEDNNELRKSLLTFVVVGGGFNGVETVGAINDFVRESIKDYYKNIYMTDVRVILVNTSDNLLEQIDEKLGKFALEKLKASGVEFIMNTRVNGATTNSAKLDNGTVIPCHTLIWTAGVTPSKLIANLPCEHDKGHRIVSNNYLEVSGYEGSVYALGDCASITDPHTGKSYPPTAQHAIRQGKVAAKNIISAIKGKAKKKTKFDYKTKGMMAEIGKRTGVAILFGRIKLHGFLAWWMWRTYYLANLPTGKKKLKVMGDWTSDLFFKPDVAMIKRSDIQSGSDNINKQSNSSSSNTKSPESQ
ncbi:MAG: 6-phosphogluconate dehydrogenase [Candidatus Nitrosopolaris wilkensis]|nr:MAG: 6-phosphogluconate dehydrogenase [Candidatus Nitrosopolaris wilkensis]